MKKIVLTGPEASGKTTLARSLAQHFQTFWTPEYARFYLTRLNRTYTFEDLEVIARGQLQWQWAYEKLDRRYLFLDTHMLVLRVWSEVRFGKTAPFIREQLRADRVDFYLLCKPDLAWTFDPLRENPHDRDALYLRYREHLDQLAVPYAEIQGVRLSERLGNALRAISRQFA